MRSINLWVLGVQSTKERDYNLTLWSLINIAKAWLLIRLFKNITFLIIFKKIKDGVCHDKQKDQ